MIALQYWVFPFQEYNISTFMFFSQLLLFLHLNVEYLGLFLHVLLLFVAIIIEMTSHLYFTSDYGIKEEFIFLIC